ncbi:MAG TPA: hypothetical protein VI756_22090 [Blastocatellia bacterium]
MEVGEEHKPAMIEFATREPLGPESMIDSLRRTGVAVPQMEDVIAYLTAHPSLVLALQPYCAAAIAAGGKVARVSLELYRDPEIDDDHLIVYVRQSPYQDDLMDRIDEARDAVRHLAPVDESAGWVHITTDFQRPR